MKKLELSLRVRDETMHFNLNHSLKQPKFDNIDCKIGETKVPINFQLINYCKIQSSMSENEMNFQYLDVLDVEFFNSNFESKEAVLSINENSIEKYSNEKKLELMASPRKARMVDKIVLSSYIQPMEWDRPSVDTPVPGLEAA